MSEGSTAGDQGHAAADRSRPTLTVVAPGGATNPSARVRALNWLRVLGVKAHAHEYLGTADVTASTLLRQGVGVLAAERALRRTARSASDLPLLVQREASPLSRGPLEVALMAAHGHAAYDVDDALHVPRPWPSPRRLLGGHLKAARLAAAADVLVAGSEHLADWARPLARRVVVVPSCVHPPDYAQKTSYEVGTPATVLWIGSSTTERHLHALAPVLASLATQLPLRVLVVGAAHADVPPALEPLVERRPWSPDVARRSLLEADVGVMPLPDSPFTRGKCAYKLLEYAVAGLPVVGTPVGASARFLASCGAPAPSTPAAWREALASILLAAPEQRAELGCAARKAAVEGYSYAAWQEEWRAAVLPR